MCGRSGILTISVERTGSAVDKDSDSFDKVDPFNSNLLQSTLYLVQHRQLPVWVVSMLLSLCCVSVSKL